MNTQQPPTPRIPLLASVSQRGEVANVDARLVNGYVEKLNDGNVMAVKRPGISSFRTFGGSSGLGIFFWNGNVYTVNGTHLYKDGSSLGVVNTTGGKYYFSSNGAVPQVLFLHNKTNAYTYDGTTFASAAVPGPGGTQYCAGAAFLDGTTYLGQNGGASIFGSGLNAYTWDAANVLKAQQYPDNLQYIFRQLNYVVALKQQSCEAFFDAGNPTGSPLQSAQGTLIPYGCRVPDSVQIIEDTALWVTGGTYGVTVMMLQNMKPRIVSTPPIERLLQQADYSVVYSWSFRLYGHRFYGLSVANNNITLVFDIEADEWYQWTDAFGAWFPAIASAWSVDNQALVQTADGDLYVFEGTNYNDAGIVFPFEIYTPNWDGGTRKKKYLHRMDFMTDQAHIGTIAVRYSEDDYQHWSQPRIIDLSRNRPALFSCGTFRKRAWHLRHFYNGPCRLKAIELDMQVGPV